MSLTSALKRPDSAVGRFMREHFPQTVPVLHELRAQEQTRPLLESPGLRPSDFGLVGTAFDYRLRYLFAVTPMQALAAWHGISKALRVAFDPDLGLGLLYAASSVAPLGKGLSGQATLAILFDQTEQAEIIAEQVPIATFHYNLRELLNTLRPVASRLGVLDERILCRYCAVLAQFEQCFRGPVAPSWPIVTALGRPGCTAETLLDLVPEPVVDDLCTLSAAAYDAFSGQFGLPFILNPVFTGSLDVGGTDADIILGGCLLEIKATKAPLDVLALYQLLGYVLLDYSDEYAIRSIGAYYARRGVTVTWALDEILQRLTGGGVPLSHLRVQFRNTLVLDN